MNRVLLFWIVGMVPFSSLAQNPFPDLAPIYVDHAVPRIDIEISSINLNTILAPGNEESDTHYPATFYFDNGTIKDTINNVGFRLRGNTSRYSQKKSFKVSFNTFERGRKWYGVEKLNLNGEHNDPTISRSKFCWDLLREIGIPAPRANHIRLFINEEYYGVYANIEHIDEEFVDTRFGNNDGNLYKCLWPADMNYLGDDPDLYKYMNGNRRAYELKRNEDEDDYSDLANLIDILNNESIEELACQLEPIFNINSFLKCVAFDILSGNWDGPLWNKNNFYLYHNLATGRFEYIPYDLDNTLGIDWSRIDWSTRNIYVWGHDEQPRPLYWRILQVPEYLIRFTYYMDKIVETIYQEEILFPKLDSIQALIAPYVATDPYYPLDYGFSIEDFNNGFSIRTPYSHTEAGIKEFIATRKESTVVQIPDYDLIPIISDVKVIQQGSSPYLSVFASVEEDDAIDKVEICYKVHQEGSKRCVELFDDGNHNDGVAGDGLFGGVLSVEATQIIYSIQSTDLKGNLGLSPVCGNQIKALKQPSTVTLAINEFMASNDTTHEDEFGEFDDWVEIHNYGESVINLSGLYLSDNHDEPTKWAFPDTSIAAEGYLIVWADDDEEQGPLHADYKLSADGEYIGIFDTDTNMNVLVDGLEFGLQESDQAIGRIPNGTGEFQIVAATPGASNEATTSIFTNLDFDIEYKIYPNPTRNRLVLQSVNSLGQPLQVKLTNLLGENIMEGMWRDKVDWNISYLSAGIYNLVAQNHSGTILLGKIVKM